ncbi:adenylate/guanylate cyclase domain-containing response regulator [Variovorax sp. dw_954]|uniref:adenylate/guanylate cyclase domain-containing protein n=1 Tax=Variovorax sp. dw_954 TaxID=2720078 RepID=UPI001BD2068A|nr:adenylate/guanylate cyclase domain-containing response regulator [Variovorax sp. dw_954]
MSVSKVLVVDDVPVNVKLLADILAVKGYAVVTASSGPQALALLPAEKPDLVLLDVMMPGMSGYEVCAAIRADPAHAMLPVVLVTALDPGKERIKGLEAGADDFLTKPVSQAELLARVRSLLRIKHLYDQVQRQSAELAEWNRQLEERVAKGVRELENLGRLKRFFSPQLAELIVAGGADDPLKSHRREITVVFLDLRGFTAFTETAEPEEVMGVLAEYHAAMGRLILQYEGTLERFSGDGIMVFFNDPVPIADPSLRAVEMALAMQQEVAVLSAAWKKHGYDLTMGVGVAQGFATIGGIGFPGRIDYGAIGTVTNLAARLCGEAAGGEILMSRRVVGALDGRLNAEAAGELMLKGFQRPVPTFRLVFG